MNPISGDDEPNPHEAADIRNKRMEAKILFDAYLLSRSVTRSIARTGQLRKATISGSCCGGDGTVSEGWALDPRRFRFGTAHRHL